LEITMDWMADPTIQAAAAAGRTSAAAGAGQRDLQSWAAQEPELFPPRPFDATLFGTLSAANAFSAEDLPAAKLTMLNRGALWGFAVDWQIDYVLKSADEVDGVVGRCLAVADGAAPVDGLTRLLEHLRAQVASGTDDGASLDAWGEELSRMLAGMRREWGWRAAGHRPTLDEYLDNADNLGSAFVNIGHWLVTTPDLELSHLADVTSALRAEQKVIRLLNDLGTVDRDVAWGDLNALLLGVERPEVAARVEALVRQTQDTLLPLVASEPRLVAFLRRQIGFCSGFYGVTDYWGQL
jgi:hypothetical protein